MTGRIRRRPRPIRRLAEAMVSPDSYGSVLVLIIGTYVISVTLTATWSRSIVLAIQIATVWLALHVSRARPGVRHVASAALLAAAAIAAANLVWRDEDGLTDSLVFLASALLYFIAPLSILRAVVEQREVTLETLLGAIDSYLLIGMFFGYLYLAIGAIADEPFFAGGIEATLPETLFFSFTTLTTTGYGNLVPAGNPGQAFAVLEMLIGQLFLITAVAKVINAWSPSRWRIGETASDADDGAEQEGGST
jgi:hypothetical protein